MNKILVASLIVVGNAGTVNTGDIRKNVGMAVHGTRNGAAYGATFVLTPAPGGHYAIGSETAS